MQRRMKAEEKVRESRHRVSRCKAFWISFRENFIQSRGGTSRDKKTTERKRKKICTGKKLKIRIAIERKLKKKNKTKDFFELYLTSLSLIGV